MRSSKWRAIMYSLNRIENNTSSGDDRTLAEHYVEQVKKEEYLDEEVFEFINRAEENIIIINP